jgi:hypothetical protein
MKNKIQLNWRCSKTNLKSTQKKLCGEYEPNQFGASYCWIHSCHKSKSLWMDAHVVNSRTTNVSGPNKVDPEFDGVIKMHDRITLSYLTIKQMCVKTKVMMFMG